MKRFFTNLKRRKLLLPLVLVLALASSGVAIWYFLVRPYAQISVTFDLVSGNYKIKTVKDRVSKKKKKKKKKKKIRSAKKRRATRTKLAKRGKRSKKRRFARKKFRRSRNR